MMTPAGPVLVPKAQMCSFPALTTHPDVMKVMTCSWISGDVEEAHEMGK